MHKRILISVFIIICLSFIYTYSCRGDSTVYFQQSLKIASFFDSIKVDFNSIKKYRAQMNIDYFGQTCVGAVNIDTVFKDPELFIKKRLHWGKWWLNNYENLKKNAFSNIHQIAGYGKPAITYLESLELNCQKTLNIYKDSTTRAEIIKKFKETKSKSKDLDKYLLDHYYTYRTLHAFKQILLIYCHKKLVDQLKSIDISKVDKNYLSKLDSTTICLAYIEKAGDIDKLLAFAKKPFNLNNSEKYTIIMSQVDKLNRDIFFKNLIKNDSLLNFVSSAKLTNIDSFTTVYSRYTSLSDNNKEIIAKPYSNIFYKALGCISDFQYPRMRYHTNVLFSSKQYFDSLNNNKNMVTEKAKNQFREFAETFLENESQYINYYSVLYSRRIDKFKKGIKSLKGN